MDGDVFSLLTGGAKFNKQRFAKDYKALTPQPHGGQTTAPPATAMPQHDGQQAASRSAKKQKGETVDISLFNSAATITQKPTPITDLPEVHTRDPHEEANVIRKSLRIKVSGTSIPAPLKTFQELSSSQHKVSKKLLDQLAANGFHEPTPIQRQAIPCLLADRELLAVAPTGSGKTLAFLLPLLAKIKQLHHTPGCPPGIKALVISPTQELAAQQARVLKLLLPGSGARACLLSKATAAGSDLSKVDILLANPLRLVHLLEQGKVQLDQVRYLVLDEADKLFELGFMEQVDALLAAAQHPQCVRALFSATLPEKVEDLARSVQQLPVRIVVGERNSAVSSVKQRLVFVGRENGKLLTLRQMLSEGLKPPVLVFVSSKERARQLHRDLMYDGFHVDSIHADQPHAARAAAVENFRRGKTWVLIATDLIGRGMDFVGVHTVVSYDFPYSAADYVHRVGRTGRAGAAGEAVTFFTEEDSWQLRSIANIIKAAGGEVPEWMLQLKKERRRKKRDRGAAALESEEEEEQQQQQQQEEGKKTQGAARGQKQQSGSAAGGQVKQRKSGGQKGSKAAAGGGQKGQGPKANRLKQG